MAVPVRLSPTRSSQLSASRLLYSVCPSQCEVRLRLRPAVASGVFFPLFSNKFEKNERGASKRAKGFLVDKK